MMMMICMSEKERERENLFNFQSFLYILILIPCQRTVGKHSPHFVICFFSLVVVSLAGQWFLNSMSSPLSILWAVL